MADTYTIAAAARLCHCDRRTLQRAIRRGTLHLDANHCLSREDLLLAGYLVTETPLAAPQVAPQVAPQATPLAVPLATPLLPLFERLTIALEGIWHELQRLQPAASAPQVMPLAPPQGAPQAAPGPPDRQPAGPTAEPAPVSPRPLARGQRKLTPRQIRALRDKHLRGVSVEALQDEYGVSRASVFRYLRSSQRPGPTPPAADTPPTGADTPGPPRRTGRPPGPLRQQILALLQAHPEGLRAEELRVYLQTPRPIGDTLQGMLRGGVITTEGRGEQRRYVATAPSQHDDT